MWVEDEMSNEDRSPEMLCLKSVLLNKLTQSTYVMCQKCVVVHVRRKKFNVVFSKKEKHKRGQIESMFWPLTFSNFRSFACAGIEFCCHFFVRFNGELRWKQVPINSMRLFNRKKST
jgi:hypothetical protein